MKIPLNKIVPSPFQVRSKISNSIIADLMKSIEEIGQIVPIKVRPLDGKYEIVYGHRRWEVAKRLKWDEIEAIIEELTDKQAKIQALAENVQRDDLTPIEEAQGYFNLWKDGNGDMTQREIADQFGKNKDHITRILNLLNRPRKIQEKISRPGSGPTGTPDGSLTVWHIAEVENANLVSMSIQDQVIEKASNEGLTVAQTRRVAQSIKAAPTEKQKQALIDAPYNPVVHDAEAIKRKDQAPKKVQRIDWANFPKTTHMLDHIKKFHNRLEGFKQSEEIGVLSPEAARFIARRISEMAEEYINWAKELEKKHGS